MGLLTLGFEFFITRLLVKIKHAKKTDTCCNEAGVYVQNIDTMLGSTLSTSNMTL